VYDYVWPPGGQLNMSDEEELLRGLRQRDAAAFTSFVRGQSIKVISLCFRMLGNRAEAEDVAQEVFITVFKMIDGFRSDSKLSTWVYRIAVNHCKNRLKYLARRRQGSREEVDENAAQIASLSPFRNPEQVATGAQIDEAVQKAMLELDEEHRTLIVLRDLEDLTVEEISEITGLPDGTVKSRLHRGRLALRKRLEKTMGKP
jgi:RNA polymerase sigma-70 factor, ECF subfamily